MFLERYEDNWPIKEYLKRHFANKRYYNRSGMELLDGKRKRSQYNIPMEDIFNFGSEEDARDAMDAAMAGDKASDESSGEGDEGEAREGDEEQ